MLKEYIISFKSANSKNQYSGALDICHTMRDEKNLCVRASGLEIFSFINSYDLRFIEENLPITGAFSPNDTNFGSQWHWANIQITGAWAITTGSTGVLVAHLDAGIDSNHPDLAGDFITGWNFVGGNSNVEDDHGHGTWNAGIISAIFNNANQVAGGCGAKLLVIKVLDSSNLGTTANLANGIMFAADNGAKILNMPIVGLSSSVVWDACIYAINKGCFQVAAAGNNNEAESTNPAGYAPVISVAANTSSDARWASSNYGTNVDLFAPGENILTTSFNGGTESVNGSSFSTSIVTSVLALMLTVNPYITADEFFDIIPDICDSVPALNPPYRINAMKAVRFAQTYIARSRRARASAPRVLVPKIVANSSKRFI